MRAVHEQGMDLGRDDLVHELLALGCTVRQVTVSLRLRIQTGDVINLKRPNRSSAVDVHQSAHLSGGPALHSLTDQKADTQPLAVQEVHLLVTAEQLRSNYEVGLHVSCGIQHVLGDM